MPTLIFLFDNPADLKSPTGLVGWLGWFALLGITLFLQWRYARYQHHWSWKQGGLFILLTLLVPVTSLLLPGLSFSSAESLPPGLMTQVPSGPTFMFLSALPWVLAAGLLGPAPAGALALASGLILALWNTHNPFLPLELALWATLFSAALHQRYRTWFYRTLRHPLPAATVLALLYPGIFLLGAVLSVEGVLVSRLDYAVSQTWNTSLAIGGSVLISGVISELLTRLFPKAWGGKGQLRPSPAESSLSARFLYGMLPITMALLVLLVVGDWIVAANAAREMLRGRMGNAAQMAAQSVPFFLETGQNLIWQISRNPELQPSSPQQVQEILAEDLRSIPYFTQMYFFDDSGELVSGHPQGGLETFPLSSEEQAGIGYALNGVAIQSYAVQPADRSPAALISFIVAVQDGFGSITGVLIGRTDLASNPAAQPLLTSLKSMEQVGGKGVLLDENGRILFHIDPDRVLEVYDGGTREETSFFSESASDLTQQLVYYQPTIGRPWSVVLTVPAGYAQHLALSIAAPLMGMIVLLSFFAVGILRLGVGVITASMQSLAVEANRMAQGELDRPLKVEGEDESGQLRQAFEQLRVRLKNRLDELNRLLVVSQEVASTLEIEGAIKSVLESALTTGAASARAVLVPALVPEMDGGSQIPQHFGAGPDQELYRSLDDQILALTQQQDRLLLTNLTRPRLLAFSPGMQRPQALIALALRHKKKFFGSLWVGFAQPHQFTDEEVRYLVTLAGQAAMAIANARLFLTAEIGRQWLEAILASTPDPVMVTDHQAALSLINPAASQVFCIPLEQYKGQPIEQLIPRDRLVGLLSSANNEAQSAEITLPDGQIYLATASTVLADGRRVGRVCVLRDVTHFKELDALKSEFVSTVSHDLRSPLTLIRGYSTMLQMVGELNEQQTSYLQKIISGVESMSRLVNNLLDLSRIEGGVGLQLERLPAQELIETVVGELQLQAAQKRIQLSMQLLPAGELLLEADHALLQQALQNLVENAIKYTESGGKVLVHLSLQDDQVVYEVRDNGIGIAPADQHRLFEKFYRAARKGMKSERGSGLGLAIVKSIVERHGGQVWVESQLGKGSNFYLVIPLRQQHGA